MTSYIHINEAEFHAFHGVMEQEKVVGNTFLVSLILEADILEATHSDCLDDTISYADVLDVVKTEMQTPSKLLEYVGGRIVRALHANFPEIRTIDLTITKKHPPVNTATKGAGIRLVSQK